MSYITLIVSVFTSAFFATIVSGYVSYALKKMDYKNEYYKVIIQKRLEAYSLIDEHLSELMLQFMDDSQKGYYAVFVNKNSLQLFINRFKPIFASSTWIGSEVIKKYIELKKTTNDFIIENNNNYSEDHMKVFAVKYYPEINVIHKSLMEIIKKDYLTLYKIKKV